MTAHRLRPRKLRGLCCSCILKRAGTKQHNRWPKPFAPNREAPRYKDCFCFVFGTLVHVRANNIAGIGQHADIEFRKHDFDPECRKRFDAFFDISKGNVFQVPMSLDAYAINAARGCLDFFIRSIAPARFLGCSML